MARIFLGIAILLIAVSGVFSFQTKSKVAGIRDELAQAKSSSETLSKAQKAAEESVKTAQEELAAANAAKEAAVAAAAAAKGEAEKAVADLGGLQSQIATKDTEIEALKTQIAAAPESTATDTTAGSELEEKVKELQAKLDEQTQIAKSLESKTAAAEQRVAELDAEKNRRQAGVNAPGLEGRVLAVDPSWNFVVLSIGDRQGVASNSTLLVKRGRTLVARLKVTSVNPTTSIADVVPGSSKEGNFIRPGDTVIYSGS